MLTKWKRPIKLNSSWSWWRKYRIDNTDFAQSKRKANRILWWKNNSEALIKIAGGEKFSWSKDEKDPGLEHLGVVMRRYLGYSWGQKGCGVFKKNSVSMSGAQHTRSHGVKPCLSGWMMSEAVFANSHKLATRNIS